MKVGDEITEMKVINQDEDAGSNEQVKPEGNRFVKWFNSNRGENLLLLGTVIGVILAIGLGFLIRGVTESDTFNSNHIAYFRLIGDLFLRMLKFLILPLIGSSLISGIAGLGTGNGGRIAGRALLYYFVSTFAAVVIGMILVLSIQPGKGKNSNVGSDEGAIDTSRHVTTQDTILDILRNLFPSNIVEMTFQQYQTQNIAQYNYRINYTNGTSILRKRIPVNFTDGIDGNVTKIFDYYKATPGTVNGLNVLGLILFCFVFGGILASMNEEGRILIKFFESLNEASIRMIKLVMMISPFGIFSLILATILEMKNPGEVFASISLYLVTVIVGLIIHGGIFLPLVFWLITRSNVLTYTKNVLEALLIAVATASSTAALPTTIKCCEEKNKIHKNVARFVLPVGATVNMNGTALYEAVAVIFIAQLNDKPLSFVDILITSVTATLASIGAASVPSAGLVTMIIILSALDLPAEQISLIYTVDWFLDRLRTSINVWGDALGCGIVAHLSKKEIADMENSEKNKKEENSDAVEEYSDDPTSHKF